MPKHQKKGLFPLYLLIALLFGGGVTAAGLWLAGYSPFLVIGQWWQGTFGQPRYIAWTVVVALPLVFLGLSMHTTKTAGLFNAGVGGSFIAGCLAAVVVGTKFQLPYGLHPVVVVIAAMTAGMLTGVLGGVLKAWLGVHEALSGLLLSGLMWMAYTALAQSSWMTELSGEALRPAATAGMELLATWKSSEAGQVFFIGFPWLQRWMTAPLSWGLLTVIPVILCWRMYLRRSRRAYEWKATQLSSEAAYHAGIPVRSNDVAALAWAGAFAGLAAAFYWRNADGLQSLSLLEGLWEPLVGALVVSMLAGDSVWGVVPAAWLVGAVFYGGGKLNTPPNYAPAETVYVFFGAVLLVMGLPRPFRYKLSKKLDHKDIEPAKQAKEEV